jgi:uncharacterized protein
VSHSQYSINPSICLDSRRAAWFPAMKILAVADLHIGYAWAQRHRGQLLPLSKPSDTLRRLLELQQFYRPAEIVLLGDIVHRALALPALKAELKELCARLPPETRLTWIAGNHDKGLERLLADCGSQGRVVRAMKAGPDVFVHGDGLSSERAAEMIQQAADRRGRIIMGHEHPAVNIGDGTTTSAKCPCFLVGETVLVLPAFSEWAAGVIVRRRSCLSALTQRSRVTQTVAILGDKLLPIPSEQ